MWCRRYSIDKSSTIGPIKPCLLKYGISPLGCSQEILWLVHCGVLPRAKVGKYGRETRSLCWPEGRRGVHSEGSVLSFPRFLLGDLSSDPWGLRPFRGLTRAFLLLPSFGGIHLPRSQPGPLCRSASPEMVFLFMGERILPNLRWRPLRLVQTIRRSPNTY
jgi:hypothetical protein